MRMLIKIGLVLALALTVTVCTTGCGKKGGGSSKSSHR